MMGGCPQGVVLADRIFDHDVDGIWSRLLAVAQVGYLFGHAVKSGWGLYGPQVSHRDR